MPLQTTLTARTLFTSEGLIEFPVVDIDSEGHIASIHSDPAALAAETSVLAPGLLDIHIHGAVGVDVMNASPGDLHQFQRFLATQGVAHYLPTTVTAPVDTTLRSLEELATLIERGPAPGEAQAVAIHIEGPFLSHAKRGVHPTEHLQPPSIELFDRMQAAARGHIRLMTIAPEPNAAGTRRDSITHTTSAFELIRHASAQGVRCSLGHSNALATEALQAIDAGAVSATHTFNAMRPLDHREPGILGVVLDDQRLYAELICDGIHVAPAVVRLWWRAKGPERAILITDAMSATGMPDGNYFLGGLPVTVSAERALMSADLAQGKETLAGSVLTLHRAIARFQQFTGAPLSEAIRLATQNPATMLGTPELTRLAPGRPATFNRFDPHGNLLETWSYGRKLT